MCPGLIGAPIWMRRGEKSANEQIAPRLLVGPTCLLFFIDETGHETFADKNYPVFGLGGCAITSSAAEGTMAKPWCAMKAEYFGGENVPLHANELRKSTSGQLAAQAKFFREQQFARLAVTMSKSAVLRAGTPPFDIVTGALINRCGDLLLRVSPDQTRWHFCTKPRTDAISLSKNTWAELSSRSTTISSPYIKGWLQKQTACPN
jgi:uncharacterized protein DUF3800